MQTAEITMGILLLVMAVFLTISILMQSSKNHRMSGTIAGGAETFFGKQKGKTIDALLSRITTIVAIIFAVLVVAMYVLQPETPSNTIQDNGMIDTTAGQVTGADEGTPEDTTADGTAAEDTASDDTASSTDATAPDTTASNTADQAAADNNASDGATAPESNEKAAQ